MLTKRVHRRVIPGETLAEAAERVYRDRWKQMRTGYTLYCQAKLAATSVASWSFLDAGATKVTSDPAAHVTVQSVTEHDLARSTGSWYAQGLAPATISKRLNCLSVMGIAVTGHRPAPGKVLRWWLRDDMRKTLLADPAISPMLKAFIEWTALTGLRVEESLRLQRRNFDPEFTEVLVDGTKTTMAQATLPLSSAAAAVARRCFDRGAPAPEDPMFTTYYEALRAEWEDCRVRLGVKDVPTSTLKSLRRTAARYLHLECGMPLDVVRQYLRHEDIQTTMGYLRLTGGYSVSEMRRYLR